ncbi:MAG: exodeoxyribonuclease VII large subunit [Candidatus Aminicenantes bacterium]|nr:exodeoxyribonuclease VII large subunit [Candidatus Aminicenantes bacterium]
MEDIFAEQKIYTVSEINHLVRQDLEESYPDIWVEGEISNFRAPASGHYYFTLKDKESQLRGVMFINRNRYLKFLPYDGLLVLVRGTITIYEPRGDYQINVDLMEPKGKGSLQLAFEQLKEKLHKEGLFAPEHKKPLPLLPQRIGIITSPTGAAIRDIIRVINRRFANVELLLFPSKVQGDEAAQEIAFAIDYMNTLPDMDVLILTRGGGSLEDLWPFNEEMVARRIFASKIPIISAVGHEIDFTISDFVADLRAPTPSAAAEIVVKNKLELQEQLNSLRWMIINSVKYRVESYRSRYNLLAKHRGFYQPLNMITSYSQRVDESIIRLNSAIAARLTAIKNQCALNRRLLEQIDLLAYIREKGEKLSAFFFSLNTAIEHYLRQLIHSLETAAGKLHSLSPLAILERGYSICHRAADRSIVKDAAQISVGEDLSVRLWRGEISCGVKKIVLSPKRGYNDGRKKV